MRRNDDNAVEAEKGKQLSAFDESSKKKWVKTGCFCASQTNNAARLTAGRANCCSFGPTLETLSDGLALALETGQRFTASVFNDLRDIAGRGVLEIHLAEGLDDGSRQFRDASFD